MHNRRTDSNWRVPLANRSYRQRKSYHTLLAARAAAIWRKRSRFYIDDLCSEQHSEMVQFKTTGLPQHFGNTNQANGAKEQLPMCTGRHHRIERIKRISSLHSTKQKPRHMQTGPHDLRSK
jgi:hypothetical protein